MKLKWGDIKTGVRGILTALVWWDKWSVHVMTDMHFPPAREISVMNVVQPAVV